MPGQDRGGGGFWGYFLFPGVSGWQKTSNFGLTSGFTISPRQTMQMHARRECATSSSKTWILNPPENKNSVPLCKYTKKLKKALPKPQTHPFPEIIFATSVISCFCHGSSGHDTFPLYVLNEKAYGWKARQRTDIRLPVQELECIHPEWW